VGAVEEEEADEEEEEVGTHLANLPQIFFKGLPPLVFPPCG